MRIKIKRDMEPNFQFTKERRLPYLSLRGRFDRGNLTKREIVSFPAYRQAGTRNDTFLNRMLVRMEDH
jgi:hypothetical protein